jgi:hypothetical protein
MARMGRVSALAERALAERAGEPADPAAFERHLAFRWDARRGAGRLLPIESPALFDLDDLLGVERGLRSPAARCALRLRSLRGPDRALPTLRSASPRCALRVPRPC